MKRKDIVAAIHEAIDAGDNARANLHRAKLRDLDAGVGLAQATVTVAPAWRPSASYGVEHEGAHTMSSRYLSDLNRALENLRDMRRQHEKLAKVVKAAKRETACESLVANGYRQHERDLQAARIVRRQAVSEYLAGQGRTYQ